MCKIGYIKNCDETSGLHHGHNQHHNVKLKC